jgi:hypothetical protein
MLKHTNHYNYKLQWLKNIIMKHFYVKYIINNININNVYDITTNKSIIIFLNLP